MQTNTFELTTYEVKTWEDGRREMLHQNGHGVSGHPKQIKRQKIRIKSYRYSKFYVLKKFVIISFSCKNVTEILNYR